MRRFSLPKGQSLVEIQLVIGLLAIFLPALFTGFAAAREGKANTNTRLQATGLLRESEEAVESVKLEGWSNVATNGTYHPVINTINNSWDLASGSETLSSFFTRSVTIASVTRDSAGNITTSGGTLDPSTKRITTTVSWTAPFASSVQSVTYIHRSENNAYNQSTQAVFNQGVHNGTTATNNIDGEVTLGAGGSGDWCQPNQNIVDELDLPRNGVANAISAIEGNAFVVTGDNSSGESFLNIGVTNTTPPVAAMSGAINGYKGNDVFGESGYGYMTTDTNSEEVVIFDLNTLAPIGAVDLPSSTNGDDVNVSGTKGYATNGTNFSSFDLTTKTGGRSPLQTITLSGTGTDIAIIGTYAYVSLSGAGNGRRLEIINISNPSSMSIVGYAAPNGGNGMDVFVNTTGTRAYLATSLSATQAEMFIIDVAIKTGARPTISSYDATGMDPKGITVVPGNRAILVGHGAEEYQVINIANENSLARCGGINFNFNVNEIAAVLESDNDAYSYIVTTDSANELKIIEGGPGGQFVTAGDFTSTYFDAGTEVAFNRLDATFDNPIQTTFRYQVGTANGDCSVAANYTFVGPNKTSALTDYFTADAAIPFDDDGLGYENPAKCIKLKLYMSTSDITFSPTLYDFTVNYSP